MLKIWYFISDFFQLVLEVFPKFTSNIINKNLKISKVFLKWNFEVKLYNKNGVFMVVFILDLFDIDGAIEKWDGK